MPYVQLCTIWPFFFTLVLLHECFFIFSFSSIMFLLHVCFSGPGLPTLSDNPIRCPLSFYFPSTTFISIIFFFVLFHPTPRPAQNKLLLFTSDCLILYIYEHACLGRRQCLKMWRIFKSVQVDCTQEHQRIYQVVQGRLWNRFVTVIMTLVTT